MLFPPLVVAEYQVSQASQLIWAHWPRIGGSHGCTGKKLAFYSNVCRSHKKMVKAKSARYKHGHCYLKVINLNLGRRCGKTEIVCHWSLLMSLELAEHSIQLLTCHISRWRLCHCSQQDNQSKSWKKVWPLFFCHWSLLMPFAPAEQSIHLLIVVEQQLL